MRKITIDEKTLRRHEETLGNCILRFLDRLSHGKGVRWGERIPKNKRDKSEIKKCDSVVSTAISGNCKDYWKWLYNQFKKNHLLTASPVALMVFAKANEKKLHALTERERSAIKDVVRHLFSYEDFREGKILLAPNESYRIQWFLKKENTNKYKTTIEKDKEFDSWKGWGITAFVESLDLRYCPYCNAETVGTAKDFVSNIDHILPKEKYPLLSLSLYNLIPSCNRCNSRFKKTKDMLENWSAQLPLERIHPYIDHAYRHFRFSYRPTSLGNLFVRKGDLNSPLKVKPNDFKGRSFVEDYNIETIYRDLYNPEINVALKMEMLCSESFKREIINQFDLSESDFDEIFRRTKFDVTEINRFRFAKLLIDLSDEVGAGSGPISKLLSN